MTFSPAPPPFWPPFTSGPPFSLRQLLLFAHIVYPLLFGNPPLNFFTTPPFLQPFWPPFAFRPLHLLATGHPPSWRFHPILPSIPPAPLLPYLWWGWNYRSPTWDLFQYIQLCRQKQCGAMTRVTGPAWDPHHLTSTDWPWNKLLWRSQTWVRASIRRKWPPSRLNPPLSRLSRGV